MMLRIREVEGKEVKLSHVIKIVRNSKPRNANNQKMVLDMEHDLCGGQRKT